jgi:curved DNA-binding protein
MNFYDILGVNRNASNVDLKEAFKKKAMTHHPDRGGSEEEFKKINEAYDTLKDPQKKQMYDQFGSTNPQQHRPQHQEYHFHTRGPNGNINVEEIFNSFFGQGDPFTRGFGPGRRAQQQNQNITIAADLELEDIVNGKSLIATFRTANGTEQTVNIDIPRGIRSGDIVNFPGMGANDFFPGRQAGDLHVKIRIRKHAIYEVDGINLYVNKNVSVLDLILGTNITVETIHGKTLNVTVPAGANAGTTFSIQEQGLPDHRSGQTGTLFIKINATTPKIDDEQIREQIRKLNDEINSRT